MQLKDADNAADSAADCAEPLTPRYALSVNKCEGSGCTQLHLMLFGGMSGESVVAETTVLTLGKHVIIPKCCITD